MLFGLFEKSYQTGTRKRCLVSRVFLEVYDGLGKVVLMLVCARQEDGCTSRISRVAWSAVCCFFVSSIIDAVELDR